MHITVIGTGFVGVVSAAVYASFGHYVTGLDIDPTKIESLKKSQVPFFEPQLEELLTSQQAAGRLTFTTNYQAAIAPADIIIIAVGTPSAPDGQADLTFVLKAAESAAPYLKDQAIVVIKSTVPPGTLNLVESTISPLATVHYSLASVPEFLKEGSAVADTLHPDRVVIGTDDDRVFAVLADLHAPLETKIVKVSVNSAQMAKYAANAYLATRITFINQIADLCDKNGAKVQEVIEAIGYDQRIGRHYWYPGFGYGGSCFPKDVKELAAYSRAVGEGNNLLNKVDELNSSRIPRLMDQFGQWVGGWSGKTVAVLGLAFKPQTDDMREAPSLATVAYLLDHQADVLGFDPKANWKSYHHLEQLPTGFSQVESIEQAVTNADVIIALIEWPTIVDFDFKSARRHTPQWFIDARNQFSRSDLEAAGYHYQGIGQ